MKRILPSSKGISKTGWHIPAYLVDDCLSDDKSVHYRRHFSQQLLDYDVEKPQWPPNFTAEGCTTNALWELGSIGYCGNRLSCLQLVDTRMIVFDPLPLRCPWLSLDLNERINIPVMNNNVIIDFGTDLVSWTGLDSILWGGECLNLCTYYVIRVSPDDKRFVNESNQIVCII